MCSLRRRFEQNQEDCTFTVLAILPTATENILEAIPVEQVLEELQRQKAERLSRSVGPSEIASSAPPSLADTTEDDGASSSLQTGSFIHASQVVTEGESSGDTAEAIPAVSEEKKSKKSKAQLWSEMKISCMHSVTFCDLVANSASDNSSLYPHLHPFPPHSPHTHPAEPPRPPQLPRVCRLTRSTTACQRRLAHQPREP